MCWPQRRVGGFAEQEYIHTLLDSLESHVFSIGEHMEHRKPHGLWNTGIAVWKLLVHGVKGIALAKVVIYETIGH